MHICCDRGHIVFGPDENILLDQTYQTTNSAFAYPASTSALIKTPTLTGTAGSYVLLLLSMFGMYLDKKDTYSFSEFNFCAFYGSRYFEIWIFLIPNNLCLPRLGQSVKGTQFQKKMK